jgi:Zn-finger nucleic acid-binding protein
MPIKPKPFVYVCPSCGWRKVVSPRSDVLLPEEYFDCCPTCSTKPLEREELKSLVKLGIGLIDKLIKH